MRDRLSSSIALPFTVLGALGALLPATASAQTPPPDQAALVAAPKPVADAPKLLPPPTDTTAATVSAGGQLATGNSRLLAMTANAKFDMRRGANGFGAAFIGNYGQSAATPGAPLATTTENFQGRLRYDRYILDRLSLFLIGTARHDKFQGLDGRLNVDPGLKYLFVSTDETGFWAELGYDFQYDARNGDSLEQVNATTGNPDPTLPLLQQTVTDHSVRAFIGFKHAFNSAVTFVTGLEYLQSLASSDTVLAGSSTDYRINYDALFAANVGAGFSVGNGYSARYDHNPLPGKTDLDTITTFNLIYAFNDSAPPPPTCPCPAPAPPPPPPEAAPPPGTTTTTTTTTPASTTTTTTTTAPPAGSAPAPTTPPPPAPAPNP